MTDDNPKRQFCLLMNINSAFEIMFPARNIQVRLALLSQSCASMSKEKKKYTDTFKLFIITSMYFFRTIPFFRTRTKTSQFIYIKDKFFDFLSFSIRHICASRSHYCFTHPRSFFVAWKTFKLEFSFSDRCTRT